jgi:hypothetical protein
MTPDDLTLRAQGEAERRWPREGRPTTNAGNPVTPQGWLDEGMASGFVLGATWAAAQAPSVEDDERPCGNCDGRRCMDCVFRAIHDRCEWSCPSCRPERDPSVEALTAEVDRLRAANLSALQSEYARFQQAQAVEARLDRLRAAASKGLTDVEYLLRLQSGKEADYVKGAFAAHDWWRTCLRGPLADLRAALTEPKETP